MKFTTSIIALGLSASALANPSYVGRRATKVQRDIAAFQSVISDVDNAVNAFDKDVQAYNGGSTDALLSDSEKIASITNSGVSTLKNEPTLSDTDAVSLTGPIQSLTSDIKTSISDLISKKSDLVAAGAGGKVEDQLKEQYTAASDLSNVIQGKVPSELSGIASQLAAGITDAIQSGIDAFSGLGSASTSAPSGATTTGAASSATSTGAATSAATSAVSTGVSAPSSASSIGAATSSGTLPGTSSTSTGVVPAYTGAASANKASGAVGLAAALLAVVAL